MIEQKERTDDEALSAYLDGELPRDDADRLTERLAAEPALARRLEQMRSADAATRQAYAAIDELPLPRGVLNLLDNGKPACRSQNAAAEKRFANPLLWLQSFFQVPVAIAASLALAAGFFANLQLGDGALPGAGFYAGTIPAGSDLHRLLESGIGAEPQTLASGATGRLELTFQDRAGDYCRQVQLDDQAATVQAVACRRGDRWRMEVASFAAPAGSHPNGQYQPAASGTPAAVSAAVDDLIGDNAPLDAETENRLVEGGWKKIEK